MRRTISMALAAVALFASEEPAQACGGAFVSDARGGTPEPLTFRAQRWIFATGITQSALFVTFDYDGHPEDFAWVLPVRGTTRVELAHPAVFDAFDAVTTPRITTPAYACVEEEATGCGGGPFAGGSSKGESGGGGLGDGADAQGSATMPAVQVVARETVGSYESLQISATDPVGLTAWLRANHYVVPTHAEPAIAAYVAEGFDFRVLRLRPGATTNALAPVRVVMAGGVSTIPLRLLAAGSGARVPITLHVLADGRLAPRDFTERSVDASKLVWDWSTSTSNWSAVRAQTLFPERSVLTSFAAAGAVNAPSDLAFGWDGRLVVVDHRAGPSIAELYFMRGSGAKEEAALSPSCRSALDRVQLGGRVGGPAGPPVSELACAGLDDLSTALVGHDPKHAWITRIELDLPRDATTKDLVLDATVQSAVTTSLTPGAQTRPNCRTVATNTPFVESASTPLGVLGALAAYVTRAYRKRAKRSAISPSILRRKPR